MNKTHQEMTELLDALESTEKWNKITRAKNEVFRKKLDKDAAEKFSDYVTQRLIDTCNDKSIFGVFYNWESKSIAEKISVTNKIVTVFTRNIKDDILNNRVQLHNSDGSEYKYTNDTIDTAFKEDIINSIPSLDVQNKDVPGAMMGVSRDRILYINYQHMFYQKSALFFLMDLKHELTHFIDMFIPSISIIDPDTNLDAQMFYVNPQRDRQLYDENPLELNANQKRKDLRIQINQMLGNQESTMLANSKNNTK
jgi:hypothetical protein